MVALALCVSASACSASEPPRSDLADGALSLAPAADVVYRCLTDKGWDVTIDWQGGIEVDSESVPVEQYDIFDADSDACWAVIDDRVKSMQPEEISEIYDDELTTRECLIDEGYSIDDPPSEQQYIDTFHGRRWSAYGNNIPLDTLSDEEWRALNEKCPQPAWSLGAQ